MQTYGKDLETSVKCLAHKEKEAGKAKEKIHKFIKERVEKWEGLKRRVEEEKAIVPNRCLSLMVGPL